MVEDKDYIYFVDSNISVDKEFKNFLKNKNKTIFIIYISIKTIESGHANTLIVEKKQNNVLAIEILEPHGYNAVLKKNDKHDKISRKITNRFGDLAGQKYTINFIGLSPENPIYGTQIGELTKSGYCYIWNIYVLLLMHLNKGLTVSLIQHYQMTMTLTEKNVRVYSLMFMIYVLLVKKYNLTVLNDIKNTTRLNILFNYLNQFSFNELWKKLFYERFDAREYSTFKVKSLEKFAKKGKVINTTSYKPIETGWCNIV